MFADPIARVAALLAAMGSVPLAMEYWQARASGREPIAVGAMRLRPPDATIDRPSVILERSLSLEEILARRGRSALGSGDPTGGCPIGIGLATLGPGGERWVLLESTPWGRLAEIPGRGIAILTHERARAMAAPGRCAPLPPPSADGSPEASLRSLGHGRRER